MYFVIAVVTWLAVSNGSLCIFFSCPCEQGNSFRSSKSCFIFISLYFGNRSTVPISAQAQSGLSYVHIHIYLSFVYQTNTLITCMKEYRCGWTDKGKLGPFHFVIIFNYYLLVILNFFWTGIMFCGWGVCVSFFGLIFKISAILNFQRSINLLKEMVVFYSD